MSTTKVITGKVRFSYVNIFKSRAFQAGQDAKYSVCLLIPKEDKATIEDQGSHRRSCPGRHQLQVGRQEAR